MGEGSGRLASGRRGLGAPHSWVLRAEGAGGLEAGSWFLTVGAQAAAALRGGGGAPVGGGLRLGCRSRPCSLPPQDVDDLEDEGGGESPPSHLCPHRPASLPLSPVSWRWEPCLFLGVLGGARASHFLSLSLSLCSLKLTPTHSGSPARLHALAQTRTRAHSAVTSTPTGARDQTSAPPPRPTRTLTRRLRATMSGVSLWQFLRPLSAPLRTSVRTSGRSPRPDAECRAELPEYICAFTLAPCCGQGGEGQDPRRRGGGGARSSSWGRGGSWNQRAERSGNWGRGGGARR